MPVFTVSVIWTVLLRAVVAAATATVAVAYCGVMAVWEPLVMTLRTA